MSKAASPTRYSADLDSFFDPNFTADISKKMRVPKRIKVGGDEDEYDDRDLNLVNSYNSSLVNEKFEMHVPERILVAGHDQHIGTRAPPREIVLENAIMPTDPGFVRVETPPRVIRLDEHQFPSALDDPNTPPEFHFEEIISNHTPKSKSSAEMIRSEATPQTVNMAVESLSTSEEIVHLRRQMAKLNRRIMALELDNLQRQQREKILYAIGLAYLLLKTVAWLSRS